MEKKQVLHCSHGLGSYSGLKISACIQEIFFLLIKKILAHGTDAGQLFAWH